MHVGQHVGQVARYRGCNERMVSLEGTLSVEREAKWPHLVVSAYMHLPLTASPGNSKLGFVTLMSSTIRTCARNENKMNSAFPGRMMCAAQIRRGVYRC